MMLCEAEAVAIGLLFVLGMAGQIRAMAIATQDITAEGIHALNETGIVRTRCLREG